MASMKDMALWQNELSAETVNMLEIEQYEIIIEETDKYLTTWQHELVTKVIDIVLKLYGNKYDITLINVVTNIVFQYMTQRVINTKVSKFSFKNFLCQAKTTYPNLEMMDMVLLSKWPSFGIYNFPQNFKSILIKVLIMALSLTDKLSLKCII